MPTHILLIESTASKRQSIKPLLSLQFPYSDVTSMGNDMKSLNFLAQPQEIKPGKSVVVIDVDLTSLDGIGFMESYSRTEHYNASRVIIVSHSGATEIPATYEKNPMVQCIARKQAKEIRACLSGYSFN